MLVFYKEGPLPLIEECEPLSVSHEENAKGNTYTHWVRSVNHFQYHVQIILKTYALDEVWELLSTDW